MEVNLKVAPDFRHMATDFLYPMLTPDDEPKGLVYTDQDVEDWRFCGWSYCDSLRGDVEHRCINVCYEEDMELAVSQVVLLFTRMFRKCPMCKVSCMVDCCKLCPHVAARRIQWAWKKHMYDPRNPRQIQRLQREFEELSS
jgi:hypothetical protein